jgi:putative serine protease PepD
MHTFLALVVVVSVLTPAAPALAQDERAFLGVQLMADEGTGKIVVLAVVGDSPADKAGIKKDDVILKLDGQDAGTLANFVDAIRSRKAGDKIKLTIKRAEEEQEIEVTLGKMG